MPVYIKSIKVLDESDFIFQKRKFIDLSIREKSLYLMFLYNLYRCLVNNAWNKYKMKIEDQE